MANNDIDVQTRGASALSSARGRFRNLSMLGGGNYKRGASALSSARGRFRNLSMLGGGNYKRGAGAYQSAASRFRNAQLLGGMGNYKRSEDDDQLYAPPAWF